MYSHTHVIKLDDIIVSIKQVKSDDNKVSQLGYVAFS